MYGLPQCVSGWTAAFVVLCATSLAAGEPECFFEDPLDDLSNWDVPTAGAGLDLELCGGPPPDVFAADIGELTVADNTLFFTPAAAPVPDSGLEAPIVFGGLNLAAASQFVEEASYRVRFDVVGQNNGEQGSGITQAAIFVAQHYDFDTEAGILDAGVTAGIGFTVSFDCPHNFDANCDHVHPFVEAPCLQEDADPEGPNDALFADFLVEANTPYTVIMDRDGVDHEGPLTLQLKLFPADREEPKEYLATWKVPFGLPAEDDPDLDHGFLLAALGSNTAALELSNFSVCEIPLADKHVRCLTCERTIDGEVIVRWDNPFDAADEEIAIAVNGEQVDTVDALDTEYVLTDVPAGDITIAVTNYSGVAAECALCENDDPEAVIEGASQLLLADALAGVVYDGSASTDPEGTELLYFWEVAEQPEGSQATIDDPFLPAIAWTADAVGEYRLRLTVSDAGCEGDPAALENTAELTVVVMDEAPPGVGPFIRGDCAQDLELNLTSGIFTLNFLFLGGVAPSCMAACDSNGDGAVDLTTVVYSLNNLFLGGPPPPEPSMCGIGTLPSDEILGCDEPACEG